MEKLNKYYTSGCGSGNGNFLEPLGFSHTNHLEEADVIIFGGGADIEPSTYKEESGPRTYTSPGREKIEIADFKEGMRLGKKFIGICRGHQLLNGDIIQ